MMRRASAGGLARLGGIGGDRRRYRSPQAGGFAIREQSAYGQGSSFAGIAAGGSLSSMFWNPANARRRLRASRSRRIGSGVFPHTDVDGSESPPSRRFRCRFHRRSDEGDIAPGRLGAGLLCGLPADRTGSCSASASTARSGWSRSTTADRSCATSASPARRRSLHDQHQPGGLLPGDRLAGARASARRSSTSTCRLTTADRSARHRHHHDRRGRRYRLRPHGRHQASRRCPARRSASATARSSTTSSRATCHDRRRSEGSTRRSTISTLPDIVTFGIRQRITDRFRVMAGAEWSNWSRFQTSRADDGRRRCAAALRIQGRLVLLPRRRIRRDRADRRARRRRLRAVADRRRRPHLPAARQRPPVALGRRQLQGERALLLRSRLQLHHTPTTPTCMHRRILAATGRTPTARSSARRDSDVHIIAAAVRVKLGGMPAQEPIITK